MIAETLSSLIPNRLAPRNATPENPSFSLNDPNAWDQLFGGTDTKSGIKVTHGTALEIAAVWQAVSVISGDIACMTLNVFKRDASDEREIDRDHVAQRLVSNRPSKWMSAFEFWRRMMVHALIWQNGYALIVRKDRLGEPTDLLNLLPDRTEPKYDSSGNLFYVTEVAGEIVPLFPEEIIHLKGLSVENGRGIDLLEKARNSWALALAAEGFNSKFFKNGAQAGGLLEVPATFSSKAKTNLEEGFSKKYVGEENWFKTVVLREGAKFHATTIDAEKSQLHELREDQVREAARWFNLPGFKLDLSDSVSYNSAEQAQLAYLNGPINHWRSAITGEASIKLLTEQEQKDNSHFFEHNVTKLIEVDTKTLNDVLAIQRQNEVISANEWRRKINLKKRPDGGGDEYVNPNTKSGGGSFSEPKEDDSEEVTDAMNRLLTDTVNRIGRRTCFDAAKAAKNPTKFIAWLDSKAHDHRSVFDNAFRPVLAVWTACKGGDTEALLCGLSGRFFATLLKDLDAVTKAPYAQDELEKNVKDKCAAFEASIADQLISMLMEKTNV